MDEQSQKIYIIGPAGSGKSFLANKLSITHPLCKGGRNLSLRTCRPARQEFQGVFQINENIKSRCLKKQLPVLDLDDIFWKVKYTEEYVSNEKQELLQNFMKSSPDGWIIEGAPQEFLNPVSEEATKIIWLNPNIFILLYRVTKRFIFTKFIKHNKTETLKSFYKIIRGIISYKLKNNLYYQHKKY